MLLLMLLHQSEENRSAYSRLHSIIEPMVHWHASVCVYECVDVCFYVYAAAAAHSMLFKWTNVVLC